VFAATEYNGPAKELIHKLKFERAGAAADDIARILALRLPALNEDTVVSFIPTATARVRIRGYDQAALIARRLAALRGVPCLPLLSRHGRQRQVGQSKAVRRKQLQRAFRIKIPYPVRYEHVVLIDDVLTTGATLEAAATVLCKAGVQRVDAVVFAAA
jgi:ComF family protein